MNELLIKFIHLKSYFIITIWYFQILETGQKISILGFTFWHTLLAWNFARNSTSRNLSMFKILTFCKEYLWNYWPEWYSEIVYHVMMIHEQWKWKWKMMVIRIKNQKRRKKKTSWIVLTLELLTCLRRIQSSTNLSRHGKCNQIWAPGCRPTGRHQVLLRLQF